MFRRLVLLSFLTLLSGLHAAHADITTGLIARYPFDGNANDISGNSNNGSLVGAVASTTDRFGLPNRAYSFNGSNTYVLVPASISLNSPTTACTQAGWAYQYGVSTVGSGFNPLIMKSNTSENAFMYRMITNPDYVGAAFNNWNTAQSAGQTTVLNTWHHFATVFNGATVKYYRDGVYLGSQPMVMTITADNRPLTIGADVPGVLEIFNGKIDDVCIYNRALSDSDILELYDQATPTAVSGAALPFKLGYSSPNPSSGVSSVEFVLDSEQVVQLDVFDVAGRRVRSLESGLRTAGAHRVTWDGRRDNGNSSPSGVYFFRLKSGNHVLTSRVVRVR
jgi:hypothetical protein